MIFAWLWLNPSDAWYSASGMSSYRPVQKSGSGLGSGSTGLSVYTNQMRYLLTDNMLINSQIHLVQPGLIGAPQLGGNNLKVYYQTALDWQLSNHVRVHLGISNLPYRGYESSWGRNLYSPYMESRR